MTTGTDRDPRVCVCARLRSGPYSSLMASLHPTSIYTYLHSCDDNRIFGFSLMLCANPDIKGCA